MTKIFFELITFSDILALGALLLSLFALAYNLYENRKDKKLYNSLIKPYREEFKTILLEVYQAINNKDPKSDQKFSEIVAQDIISPIFVKRYLSILNQLGILKTEWNFLAIKNIKEQKGMVFTEKDCLRIIEEVDNGIFDNELLGKKNPPKIGNDHIDSLPFMG